MNRILLILGSIAIGAVVEAQEVNVRVVDIAVTSAVESRNPTNRLAEQTGCQREQPDEDDIPLLPPLNRLYVWTKVSSTSDVVMRHAYYKDGIRVRTQETYTPLIDRAIRTVRDIRVTLGSERIARIELQIRPSSGWRTWSSKTIDYAVHDGVWRTEVHLAGNSSGESLCTIYFRISR